MDALLAAEAVMFIVKGKSYDNWEFWLYVWGEVRSRDHRSVFKDFKYGVNVMIDDSVYWVVNRGVGYKGVTCVY